jgi:hypothetical protein
MYPRVAKAVFLIAYTANMYAINSYRHGFRLTIANVALGSLQTPHAHEAWLINTFDTDPNDVM